MAYFNELPNIEYISPFEDSTSNSDYISSKNIFLRAKLRDTIKKIVSGFNDYYIKDGERPDTIAEEIYDDPELDWVILITNNITNINDQWPLDNNSFHNYLLDKYGSEENIYAVHHYETLEIKDQFNRTVLDEGFIVDYGFSRSFTTTEGSSTYTLPAYQDSNLSTTIKINLNQFLEVIGRNFSLKSKINDINITESTFYVYGRNTIYNININNTLTTWPSGWGGNLPVKLRNNQDFNFSIGDEIGNTYITLPPYLYELVRTEQDGQIDTNFVFLPQT